MSTNPIIDEHITVYLSITGWTCVHRILKDWDNDGEPYWDNWTTGFGKYKTKEDAINKEAKQWAEMEGIKLVGV